MTDSRAALEESLLTKISKEWPARTPAAQELIRYVAKVAADAVESVEQESSSLKLLLSAMCRGKARLSNSNLPTLVIGEMTNCGREAAYYQIELDSSGIPVLTPEIIEALKNAAIF